MNRIVPLTLWGLVAGAAMMAGVTGCSRASAQPTSAAQIERGRYLVEQVAMCTDCHSPRNPNGSFDTAHPLGGSPLGFAATVPVPSWAGFAPAIAGLPGYTDEQAVRLFETGIARTQQPARLPMPSFRFSHEDAVAVVAYLRSVPPATSP